MTTELNTILKLEVPLVVILAERTMDLGEVCDMVPGTIIELPKGADEDLEIRVNNRAIGTGWAVKVGENFGVRVGYVGAPQARVHAIADLPASPATEEDMDAEAIAAALLSGQ